MPRAALRVGILALAWACGESITQPEAASVSLSASSVTLRLGDTATVAATALDNTGAEIPGADIRWTSTDALGVAVVTQTGLISAVGAGTAKIVAEYVGLSATLDVMVTADLVHIESGSFHTCGITVLDRAACWGSNSSGKLGTGTLFNNGTPALVTGLTTPARTVSAGGNFSCALDDRGAAFCWGLNSTGQLGIGSIGSVPQVSAAPVTGSHSFTTITTGDRHACALTSVGEAYCWGGGGWGQLGVGTPISTCGFEPCELRPRKIEGFTFDVLSAGLQHTCGIIPGGEAYCWGVNHAGAIGDSSEIPTFFDPNPVAGGHLFQSIAGADDHTCAITTAGAAYCWGINGDGQLGQDSPFARTYPFPVSGGIVFQTVTAGGNHTCALTPDGTSYCWGRNFEGELGIGTRISSTTPVAVSSGLTFANLTAGATHSCGMADTGDAYCWGWNLVGQLGVGSGGDRLVPTLVVGQ